MQRFMPILRFGAALAAVAVFLFPLLWLVFASLKTGTFNGDSGHGFMQWGLSLANYRAIFSSTTPDALESRSAIVDSVLIASCSAVLAVGFGAMAAFALSRLHFAWQRSYILGILLFRLVPPMALTIPALFLLHDVGLFNSRSGLILMHALINLPVAALMLKSFMDGVPTDIDDAARLDGATRFQTFHRIVLPMIGTGLAATFMICFLFSWTEFLMSLFLSVSFRTLPVKLSILSEGSIGWMAALASIAILPPLVLGLLTQRHLVRGLTLGFHK
jgi:multiple sugar transport system permease protein